MSENKFYLSQISRFGQKRKLENLRSPLDDHPSSTLWLSLGCHESGDWLRRYRKGRLKCGFIIDNPDGIMNREEVLSRVAEHREELEQLGVKTLNLFGSIARNEAHSESDVDFLVEFSIEAGFFDLFRVQHYLEDLLKRKVDGGTEDALREHLRQPVMRDVIRVF